MLQRTLVRGRRLHQQLQQLLLQRRWTSGSAATASDAPAAYSRTVSSFHWVVGALMIAVVGTVKAAQNTEDKKLKGKLMTVHKSLALVIAGLVPARLIARVASKVPRHIPDYKPLELAGAASHYALYGSMIALPVTGIGMGYYNGFGVSFFNMGKVVPGAEKPNKPLAGQLYKAHKLLGQITEFLIPLHVGGAIMHSIRGHRIFARINPFSSPSAANAAAKSI